MARFFGIIILLLLLIPVEASAQSDWMPGYVITLEGDTLNGLVRDRDTGPFGGMYRKVLWKGEDLRKRPRKRKLRFRPHQIQGYRMGNSDFIVLRTITQTVLFVNRTWIDDRRGRPTIYRVIHRGPLSLLYDEFTDEDNFLIDFVPYFKRENDIFLQRATQGVFGLKKKRLAEYFSDRPDLVQKIEDGVLKTPMEVVRAYEAGE